jgi:hypothetical protein
MKLSSSSNRSLLPYMIPCHTGICMEFNLYSISNNLHVRRPDIMDEQGKIIWFLFIVSPYLFVIKFETSILRMSNLSIYSLISVRQIGGRGFPMRTLIRNMSATNSRLLQWQLQKLGKTDKILVLGDNDSVLKFRSADYHGNRPRITGQSGTYFE